MKRRTASYAGLALVVFAGALYALQVPLATILSAQNGAKAQAPIFEVDPFWPKPLPNHWNLGSTIGLSVDAQDHVWIVHRPGTVEDNFKAADFTPVIGVCCKVAPDVLEFDANGVLVGNWGGKGTGYEWPESNHGITVDSKGGVWIGGNGNTDTQILKFDKKGKFLFQLGKQGVHNGSNDTENFWRPAKIVEDPDANEVYIADGYGNRRIIVLDRETGKVKRLWGAYGKKPDDAKVPPYDPKAEPSQHFNTVHCARCRKTVRLRLRPRERSHSGIPQGRHLRQGSVLPTRPRAALRRRVGHDVVARPRRYFCITPTALTKICIVEARHAGNADVLSAMAAAAPVLRRAQPGYRFEEGNLYATETYTGARIQRFLYKGVGPVAKASQGVLWNK